MTGFFRSRRSVWGRPARDLQIRYEGADLDELLHENHGVSSVFLAPAAGREHLDIERVRAKNKRWLGEWEATIPPGSAASAPTWEEFPRLMDRKQAAGDALSMTVVVDGEIAGLVSVGAVERGAMHLGVLGYWMAENQAGKGIASLAVAATIDLVLSHLDLHRIEVNVRPENWPSLGLVRKLGLREEGYKPRYMHINGRWADHVGFAVDQEDLARMRGGSLVEDRVRRGRKH